MTSPEVVRRKGRSLMSEEWQAARTHLGGALAKVASLGLTPGEVQALLDELLSREGEPNGKHTADRG